MRKTRAVLTKTALKKRVILSQNSLRRSRVQETKRVRSMMVFLVQFKGALAVGQVSTFKGMLQVKTSSTTPWMWRNAWEREISCGKLTPSRSTAQLEISLL